MGGTFDPIHYGHIELAKQALYQFKLDKVLIMISPMPPHKKGQYITPIDHRAQMIKLSIEDSGCEQLVFSDFEMKRSGYIYTAETLTLLKKQNPDTEYYFILGEDSLNNINRWYHPEIVMDNAVLIAACRDSDNISTLMHTISELVSVYSCNIKILKNKYMDISSSSIRCNIKNNQNVQKYLSPSVLKYITDNDLYIS